ncbi:hypothetical protein [Sphingomonas sp. 3-13AW]|uniref:hypothetical protein n=1 Tax=Sphingomonas sp. 3-13AW TaxID=3050450 RepID=UPI003BB5A82C
MPFHRTPAEMAADASFARSPAGESLSRHLLWLTPDDLNTIGPEPEKPAHRVDYSDVDAVARQRELTTCWQDWWHKVSTRVDLRRREALVDPVWASEYEKLLRDRRAVAPSERADMEAAWAAYDAANPERGLSVEEVSRRNAASERRSSLVKEYHLTRKAAPEHPRLREILAEVRECDRISDDLYALGHSRAPFKHPA